MRGAGQKGAAIMGKIFYGIFCDDIRHEVTGKFTLVGCYSDHLLVAEVPTALPKLHPFKTSYIIFV